MSHSQFRYAGTYTETCMGQPLRQAYDYWQDQPGISRGCSNVEPTGPELGRHSLVGSFLRQRCFSTLAATRGDQTNNDLPVRRRIDARMSA